MRTCLHSLYLEKKKNIFVVNGIIWVLVIVYLCMFLWSLT